MENKEEIKKENEEKFFSKLWEVKSNDPRKVVEFIKENPYAFSPEIDVNFVESYLIEEGSEEFIKFISTEALELINPELIKENIHLRKIIANCFIAPGKYIERLAEDLENVRYIDSYKVYEECDGEDLSKYYEDFYNNFNQNDDIVAFMMPSRLFESEEKTIDSLRNHNEYPPSFIIEKLIELDNFNKIEDFIDLDDGASVLAWIHALDDAGKDYLIKKEMRNKAGESLIKLVDKEKSGFDLDILLSGDVDFLVESYIRNNIEIPEEVKNETTIERIQRITKEIEAERLQEEDQKCDEALALVEELDKEQEGQTQGEE